jgi:hypothetical protein
VARDRHYATHPEDRGANVVIFKFYNDEEMADESQNCAPSVGVCTENPIGVDDAPESPKLAE